MTEFERIRSMSIDELARFNVRWVAKDNTYWDTDGYDSYPIYKIEYGYQTSSGHFFKREDKEEAIKHEIRWLNSQVK